MGVSRVTVIKWIKSGRVAAFSVHGRWRTPYGEVERVLRGVQGVRRVAIYARVSSNTQRGDLERQVESLKLWVSKNLPRAEYIVVTDVASGLRDVYVVFQEEPKDYAKELVEDFVEIVTSFASRIYGKRSKRYRKVVECVGEAVEDPD